MSSPDKLRGAEKVARIPIKVEPTGTPARKPPWIRARAPASPNVARLKGILREHRLHTVCEEASCPNLGECFGHGTATFMIMGDICTRRCPFCDVAHGKPAALDTEEPENLGRVIADMNLKYVVITSVDRDDLRDGGAAHFVECIDAVRRLSPQTRIEILVPDFRGRMDVALALMEQAPPMSSTTTSRPCRGCTARLAPGPTMPGPWSCCSASSAHVRRCRPNRD